MRQLLYAIITIVGLGAPSLGQSQSGTQAAAEPRVAPDTFRATFDVVTRGVTVAQTEWTMHRPAAGRYTYVSRSETTGVLSLVRKDTILERSEGRWVGNAPQPERYLYDRQRGDKRRRVHIDFNWQTRTASNSVGESTWHMSVPDGAVDKLSYLLVMMHDLRAGKRLLDYAVADGGTLKTYSLEVLGRAPISTELGDFDTVKVRRNRASSKRETIFWCAEDLGFFPVKISHRESDGEMLELRLRTVQGL